MRGILIGAALGALLVLVLLGTVRLFSWSCQNPRFWERRSRAWAKWACAMILLTTGMSLSLTILRLVR